MTGVCDNKSLSMPARIRHVLRHVPVAKRDSQFQGCALGLALALLCMAPMTLAQSQSQSQSQQTQAQTQSKSEPQSGAQTQPQSQPQSQSEQKTDSLVEASRKAKAQKAKSAPAKVYTDDDVSNLTPRGVSVVGDSDAAGASASADNSADAVAAQGAGQATGGTGKDEAYWRGRAHQIQSQIAAVDDEIAKTQDDIKKNGAVSIDPNSGYQQAVILVHDRNEQLKELQAQKEKLQEQMEALAEEGRKAGADAGWFR